MNFRRQDKIAKKIAQLHSTGKISDEIMLLYGISGDLPDRREFNQLSDQEKLNFWEERLQNRFGSTWRSEVRNIPEFLKEIRKIDHKWANEGF